MAPAAQRARALSAVDFGPEGRVRGRVLKRPVWVLFHVPDARIVPFAAVVAQRAVLKRRPDVRFGGANE
jgi:hypothetical protein